MGDLSRDPSPADLEKMQFLECALLEAMRIHGVFPVIFRKASKDTVLNKSSGDKLKISWIIKQNSYYE